MCRGIFKVVQMVRNLHLLSSKSSGRCLSFTFGPIGSLLVILFQATAFATAAAATATDDAVGPPRQLLGQ